MIYTLKAHETYQRMLTSAETLATPLLALVIDEWGVEALDWDAETLNVELQQTFQVKAHPVVLDKLNAAVVGVTTDAFYHDWAALAQACNVLNDARLLLSPIDPVTPEEAAWALTEMSLWEDAEDRPEFSPEVRTWLGTVCTEHGLVKLPPALKDADVGDAEQRATENLGDDPIMFKGWHQTQQRYARDVEQYVSDRFKLLIEQLDELPLQTRDKDSWSQFMKRVDRALQKGSTP